MSKFIGLFVIFALYSPLFWYLSGLREKYFSVSLRVLEFGEGVILVFLTIMPLVAMVYIQKRWKE